MKITMGIISKAVYSLVCLKFNKVPVRIINSEIAKKAPLIFNRGIKTNAVVSGPRTEPIVFQ